MRDLLIDTDTASDDAVALILALRDPDVAVRGITTVAGNVSAQQAARNALLVVECCGADVPVFVGCDAPVLRPANDASWFHGRDGMSDVGFAPQKRLPEPCHGVDALLELSREFPGCTLVTLGPLTNVAVALLRDPDLANRVGRCVVMGGNPCCVGNVTPAAEYNVWCDPEAAQVVMASGLPVELVGWHLSRGDAVLNATEIDALLATGEPLARFAVECNATAMAAYRTQTGENGISLPDPVAMAVALDPTLATSATKPPRHGRVPERTDPGHDGGRPVERRRRRPQRRPVAPGRADRAAVPGGLDDGRCGLQAAAARGVGRLSMADAARPSRPPVRLLFVCGRNRLRSPTAEAVFAAEGVETQSAGVSPDADTPLDADAIAWADVVFFMEPEHRTKAARQFGPALRNKRVVCLNVPDKYAYMDDALVRLLRQRVPRSVPRLRDTGD